ncbi:2-dehydro-3-deoxyphosphogluconate aldolase / (4S)-4-hydroxy-2-oxoglutarate aldolase [Halopelagius inordinatus]|uniref:2-dehydro-3-deoxyphosphogluconate aldolase / (4S)-4-hydroxy-2-oxoglutarate aldolase n=1 Tax=Halopelagius inordinatus TaxID=553467 RepID=A0A1I2NEV7_9EURY|nr:bifunctional 4-hydroxy-2-oxoglutarate aldolase/2-dehydro-3-deoxy-phosphogluconate aldolase [Halopelagius inordinatus]SFG02414.1 2-dehydro-3-deoxyphosphogluconate aldolase / (4S)-4-hydroxy-2-oxoglutarate aldolase [Halopelagius inordinatus]
MVALDVHEDMDRLAESGVVAVMRGADADTVIEVAQALNEGGVTAYEITADNPDAMELIRELSGSFTDDEAIVGAGTVLDGETAGQAIRAGAEFVVSPSFHEDVVETSNRHGTLVAPGIFTPTEAIRAFETGADFVKLFPASTAGPKHLSSIQGPLPQIPIMPTGGIDIDNAPAFIEAGAVVVGAGSAIMDADAIEAGDYESITETAREFTDAIEAARS